MTLTYVPDPAPAHWLTESDTPDDQLLNFGPAVFAASARLRFIPDPSHRGQAESEVQLRENHPSDIAQARRALHQLERFTRRPDECFFCVWEGYSDITLPPEVTEASLVVLPHRRYVLFRGPLGSIDSWEDVFGHGQPVAPPAFVWPADRAWLFASDVDPHWAGISADAATIAALVVDEELDVAPAEPANQQPLYY